MRAQQFPHPYDIWLCDEEPASYRQWCDENGIRISSRYGVEAYHRDEWPRRTRCKEGNLSYFYDHFGYWNYDVVAQLDCDHVPSPTYLAEMVRPFADPAVGYVAAPSMCDANANESWSARGRLHWEGSFHGPTQLGYNDGLAPVCIGSHYAIRTQALRDIGGLGPELAEDFSTSFLMNSAGWRGVFAIAAEAHGDGPLTFQDMVVQEFQWSRSLNTMLLRLVPRHLGRLGWALRVRFLYSLLYYGSLSLITICGLLLPSIAAVAGLPWMSVNYLDFLVRWWFVAVWMMALAWFLRRRGMRRPANAPIVSWESWLYALARWPYIARGVAAAIVEDIRHRKIIFKVTPKSLDGLTSLPPSLIAPYVLVSVVLGIAAIVGELLWTSTVGYVFLCLLGSFTYLMVAFAVCILHAREASRRVRIPFATAVNKSVPNALALSALTVPLAVVNVTIFPEYAIYALGWH
jgi:cellulose synthase/poly-beta-1,6-N-acetylglucosamine synthase-like glycosyltransferase